MPLTGPAEMNRRHARFWAEQTHLRQVRMDDRILVTAGTESVPEPLLAQLAVGGKLVAPVGPPGRQRLRVIRRRRGDYAQEDGGEDVTFVPLLGRFAGSVNA